MILEIHKKTFATYYLLIFLWNWEKLPGYCVDVLFAETNNAVARLDIFQRLDGSVFLYQFRFPFMLYNL